MSLRRLVLIACALIAAVLLGACGSSSSSSSDASAAAVLKDTFGPNRTVRSGRVDLAVTLDAKGLRSVPSPVAIKLSGPFESKGLGSGALPIFDLTVGLTTGAQTFDAGAISTGDKGFLKFQGQAYALSPALFAQFEQGYERAAKQAGARKGTTTLKNLGIDPLHWVKGARTAPDENVGGVPTKHVSAQIDVPRLLADVNVLLGKADRVGVAGTTGAPVPSKLTDEQIQQIEDAVKSADFEVWSGKEDKTLRRMRIAVAFDVPPAARAAAGGLQSGRVALDVSIAELNRPQSVEAPASSRPLSELTSRLQGLTGAAVGSGGATSTTPPPTAPSTTTPGAPAGASKYLRCLRRAGQDIAKVQGCAKLLGQ